MAEPTVWASSLDTVEYRSAENTVVASQYTVIPTRNRLSTFSKTDPNHMAIVIGVFVVFVEETKLSRVKNVKLETLNFILLPFPSSNSR